MKSRVSLVEVHVVCFVSNMFQEDPDPRIVGLQFIGDLNELIAPSGAELKSETNLETNLEITKPHLGNLRLHFWLLDLPDDFLHISTSFSFGLYFLILRSP